MYECTVCNRFTCVGHDCGCFPRVSVSLLIEKAKGLIGGKFIDNTAEGLHIPLNAWTIEDEWGGLAHFSGNFESLTTNGPVLDDIFADQLTKELGYVYEPKQLAVWELGEDKGILISLSALWSVIILPLLVEGGRFTVSMFSDATALLLLLVVVLLFSVQGRAQVPTNVIPTNLPGITTTVDPGTTFNPLTASAQDLATNGYPPRPNYEGLISWSRAMRASKQRIVPTLVQSPVFHGPIQAPTSQNNSALVGAYNWSGYMTTKVVTAQSDPAAFSTVSADYVIPVASQAYGSCTGGWAHSSTWVGLDGAGSPDVLQAGSEADAFCLSDPAGLGAPATSQFYSAWFEWFPFSPVRITNLAVAAGNDLYVAVWSTGPQTGNAYILNYNTGQYATVALTAPDGVSLVGNSAEWIVERPGSGDNPTPLTNYASEYFSEASAFDNSGNNFGPGSSGSVPVVMFDDNGRPISQPKLLGTHGIKLRDRGSAANGGISFYDEGSGPDGVIEPIPMRPSSRRN